MWDGTGFYEHPTWVLPTVGNGSSSLLPTPTVSDAKDSGGEATLAYLRGRPHRSQLPAVIVQLLPTPRASDGGNENGHGRTWSTTDFNLHSWAREQIEGIPIRRTGDRTPPPSTDGNT